MASFDFPFLLKIHGLDGPVIKGKKNLDIVVGSKTFLPRFLRARSRDITQAFQFFKSVPIDLSFRPVSFGIGQALNHLSELLAIAGQFFLPGEIFDFIKISRQE